MKAIKYFVGRHSLRLISTHGNRKQTSSKNVTDYHIWNCVETITKAVTLVSGNEKPNIISWCSMVYRYAFINNNNNNEWRILRRFFIVVGSTAKVHRNVWPRLTSIPSAHCIIAVAIVIIIVMARHGELLKLIPNQYQFSTTCFMYEKLNKHLSNGAISLWMVVLLRKFMHSCKNIFY